MVTLREAKRFAPKDGHAFQWASLGEPQNSTVGRRDLSVGVATELSMLRNLALE